MQQEQNGIYDVTATPKNEKVTIHKELTAESDGSVAIGGFCTISDNDADAKLYR